MARDKKIQGTIYAFISACAFGFIPIFARFAYNTGITPVTVIFLRFLFSIIILLFYFLINKIDFRIEKKLLPQFAFLGIIGNGATGITLFLSYNYISSGLSTVIHFIYPAIVTLLSIVFFKEKINLRKIISLVFCIAGVYVLIGFSAVKLDIRGVALSLASGVLYSIYILGIDHSDIRKVDTLVITFYVLIFSLIGALTFGIIDNSISFNFHPQGYIYVVALSLICTIIALSIFAKAIMMIGSSNASILSTLEPITSIILSTIIFGESITINTILGSVLIISSVYILIISKK